MTERTPTNPPLHPTWAMTKQLLDDPELRGMVSAILADRGSAADPDIEGYLARELCDRVRAKLEEQVSRLGDEALLLHAAIGEFILQVSWVAVAHAVIAANPNLRSKPKIDVTQPPKGSLWRLRDVPQEPVVYRVIGRDVNWVEVELLDRKTAYCTGEESISRDEFERCFRRTIEPLAWQRLGVR